MGTILPASRKNMEQFERDLCDRNDDDWYVPDCCLEWIAEKEYRIYERECFEVYIENSED